MIFLLKDIINKQKMKSLNYSKILSIRKRRNILIVAYNMGSKNYLFGLGPKSFRYKCKEKSIRWKKQNNLMREKD